jgi:hypothetical protein
VKYITVGGLACALNGHVRTTEDVDILVLREAANLRRLLGVLAGFGEGHAAELTVEDFTDEEGAIRVVEDFPLDIFTRMAGHRYEDLLPNLKVHVVEEVEVPYLDARGLILLKQNSLRERDRIDVLALRQLLDGE